MPTFSVSQLDWRSSRRRIWSCTDRVAKRDLYLESGVDEYWIVDLDAKLVERWTPALGERISITRMGGGAVSQSLS